MIRCYLHQQDEPKGYARCESCGHSFVTPRSLVEAYRFRWNNNRARRDISWWSWVRAWFRSARWIDACPYCCGWLWK